MMRGLFNLKRLTTEQIVDIIDYAEAEAVKEVTPSLYRYLAVGALAGILLACAFVTLRMLTDNTMKTDDDVERYLQLPVLAAIPFFKE